MAQVVVRGLYRRIVARAEEDYGDDLESEEDEANPYPLEGKYADELDRQRYVEARLLLWMLIVPQTPRHARDRA